MRILLLRTSALGDVVHCLPVLRALRRTLPEARIAWVVEKVFAPILDGHPDLDTVIPVRMRGWRKKPFSRPVRREIFDAVGAMRSFRPDVALDLMGNHKAGVLARLSGAKRILGARRQDRREPSSALWIRETVPVASRHAVDRALDLLAPLDVPSAPVDFGGDLLLKPAPPEAEAFLATRRRPFVLIQAGAGWGNKTYPPALWGEVARCLGAAAGVDVLVPIAPGEAHLAEGVVEASDGAAEAVDAGSFFVLAALVRESRLLLGGDTGPLHLAHALGTPVLAVMGPTDPERHGPYGSTDATLVHRLPCSFCYKRLEEAKACLLHVSPRSIVARALDLLGHGGEAAGTMSE